MTNIRTITKKKTSERRLNMLVKVLSFNLSFNHLSIAKKEFLSNSFKEAKYYYNYLLHWSQKTIIDDFGNLLYPNHLKDFDEKINLISVYNSSSKQYFDYEIQYLSSQIKQKIKDKVLDNIKSLSTKKNNGFKTGKLKFKSSVNIPLKQFNNTFYLDNDCKYLSIQGFKDSFKLHRNKAFSLLSKELGFDNLSLNDLIESNVIEIANAELIKSGFKHNATYQFKLTIYINPDIYNQDIELALIHSNLKPRFNKNRPIYKILNNNFNNNSNKNIIDENYHNKSYINSYITPIEELKETYLNKSINKTIKQFRFNLTEEQQDRLSCTSIGLDAGIASELTLNFNEIYQSIEINSRNNVYLNHVLKEIKLTQTTLNKFIERSKRLNRKSSQGKITTYTKSRAYYNIRNKLNKLWTKYENIKDNMVNHVMGYLKSFNKVYFQDELINHWHKDTLKGYGKKIQAGILGKVYGKLKLLNKFNPAKYVMLSKSERTTKTCIKCHTINPIKLSNRVYKCNCGYRNDRDTHSAYNMISISSLNNYSNKSSNKLNDLNSNKQESGRDSVKNNLVKNITNVNETEFNYEVIMNKLCSKSYIKAMLNSFI